LLGAARLQYMLLFLAFVRAAHYWTKVHPEIEFEGDIKHLLATHEALATCILNDPEAHSTSLGSVDQLLLEELPGLRLKADKAIGLLAAIVDSSDDAIVSKNLDGIITSWNKGAERIFGYTAEEAIGQHITLIIPSDRRDEERDILARLKRGERVDHFETVRVRKDRTLLDISLTISPVKDAAGCVVGASKVARDITERRQVEQALAERALLLDLSNDAILVRDGADRITYWNKSASELYGYTREEALGRVSHELLHTEFPEPPDRITEQLHSDSRWTGELIHRRKNGNEIVVMSRWVLNRDDRGNRKCVLETNNDITQQKQSERSLRESENRLRTLTDTLETQVRIRTEQLVQRNAEVLMQAEQLRDLSHRMMQIQDDERRHIARDLHYSAGQLLTVLAMNLSTLVLNAQEKAPEIAESAEEARELVRQLTSEIRTTSYLLHPPLLDEEGLQAAISWYVRGLSERSGLEITFNISEGFGRLPREMELTVFRLVQECLTNIHRHSGSKVAAIRIKRADRRAFLEVEDAGRGISPEKLLEIQSHGAGVGIRGMRERVLQCEGEMKIESEGRGTKISITLPTG
jgi:PAS domain S-box-containing protein